MGPSTCYMLLVPLLIGPVVLVALLALARMESWLDGDAGGRVDTSPVGEVLPIDSAAAGESVVFPSVAPDVIAAPTFVPRGSNITPLH